MKKLLEKQSWHLLALLILLAGVYVLRQSEGFLVGELFRVNTETWFWLAVSAPIAHQVFVLLAWRGQLHYKWMTRWFGKSDFLVFRVIFAVLFLGRPVSLILLGLSNTDTLPFPFFWRILLSLILFLPAVYLVYSVKKYFGIKRAFGADHFDPAYRDLPMVTEGIYKYTSNGMYTVGFFPLWIIAVLFASKAALLIAGFNHLYIWVHYYTTEKPDMEVIYGGGINFEG